MAQVLFQALDGVKVGDRDLLVVDFDLSEVLLILFHDLGGTKDLKFKQPGESQLDLPGCSLNLGVLGPWQQRSQLVTRSAGRK